MHNLVQITPEDFSGKIFHMIAHEHMLITSGDETGFNTMTASLGMFGMESWKYAATCYVRRATHTFSFLEKNDLFTLSFFGGKYQHEVDRILGVKSGRDGDKIKESGLTPVFLSRTVAFAEATVVMVCRKMYVRDMDTQCYVHADEIPSMYQKGILHRAYTGEIIAMYVKSGG
ncbi:MAG: flavin reductase [Spirochaetes bacterium]|nr:flavin reductase [Spirochaetota bacterium]